MQGLDSELLSIRTAWFSSLIYCSLLPASNNLAHDTDSCCFLWEQWGFLLMEIFPVSMKRIITSDGQILTTTWLDFWEHDHLFQQDFGRRGICPFVQDVECLKDIWKFKENLTVLSTVYMQHIQCAVVCILNERYLIKHSYTTLLTFSDNKD